MAGDGAAADAEDHPVQGVRGDDVGTGGAADGAEGDGGQRKNGIPEFHESSLKLFRFFHIFRFENVIV